MIDIADVLLAAAEHRPYYRRALAALTPVARPGLGTVAVDRWWRLYYDPAWLAALALRMRATVISSHEIEHLIRGHCDRMSDADPHMRNVAGDMEINDDAPEADLPAGALRPAMYGLQDGLLAEEYLARLSTACDQAGTCGGGSGAGRPVDGELGPPGDGAGVPGVTDAEAETLRDAVAADVRTAAATTPGSVPAGIVLWAQARARVVCIPWRRRLAISLRRALASVGRDDRSWRRLSTRALARGVVAPGMVGRRPRVAIVTDASGSMATDEIGATVLGAVRALAAGADTREWTCDTTARRHRRGERRGGGGTDLRPAIAAAAAWHPDLIAVVTDGHTPWPEAPPVARVLIVRVGDGAGPSWVHDEVTP